MQDDTDVPSCVERLPGQNSLPLTDHVACRVFHCLSSKVRPDTPPASHKQQRGCHMQLMRTAGVQPMAAAHSEPHVRFVQQTLSQTDHNSTGAVAICWRARQTT